MYLFIYKKFFFCIFKINFFLLLLNIRQIDSKRKIDNYKLKTKQNTINHRLIKCYHEEEKFSKYSSKTRTYTHTQGKRFNAQKCVSQCKLPTTTTTKRSKF